MTNHLELLALEKTYASGFHLHPLHIDLMEGEFFTLLGPSGCGKTTALKVIAGLLAPTSGSIHLNGQEITTLPAEKRQFGMMFQQPHLFPHMSVGDNVAFGLKMNNVSKKERLRRAEEVLEQVGLEGFSGRSPYELSGGQQQRVALARAIVMEPRLLLLDEPFSALDPDLRDDMQQLVKRVQRKHKLTTICVTHDQQEAFLLSDRIGIMKAGRLLQVDAPATVYDSPRSIEVAQFLGHRNVFTLQVKSGIIEGGLWHGEAVEGVEDGSYETVLSPEAVQVDANGTVATVVGVHRFKGVAEVDLEVAGQTIRMRSLSQVASRLAKGDHVSVTPPFQALYWIPKK